MIKKLAKGLMLTVIAAVCLMANCLTASAAATYTVPVTVKYGQTEARTMCDMINSFRQSSDAWYYTDDSKTTKQTVSGLSKLEYDYGLEEIAMQRAAEIAVSFSHTRPDGTNCFTVTSSKGTTASGENIAAGYGMLSTAKEAFIDWREDNDGYSGQGHRRNMLNSNFTHVGVAHVVVNGYHYWVQEFGYRASGVSKTSANDGNKTVNVKVDSSKITSLSVSASATSLKLSLGKTANVPTASASMFLSGTWGDAIKSTVTPDWSVSGSAVTVSGGKITAKSVGTATLTATVYGKNLTVTVTVECTDHKWGSWSTAKEATCTDKGSQTRKCTLCGKTETKSIDAKGHSFGAYSVTKAATCTEKGTEARKCSACGKTETRSLDAKGHSFGEYKVITKATADKEGLEERTCSACGKTEQRTIAKLPPVTTTTTVTDKTPAGTTAPTGSATETTAPDTTGGEQTTTTPEEGAEPAVSETTDEIADISATVTDADSTDDTSSDEPSKADDSDNTSAADAPEASGGSGSDNDDSSSQSAADITTTDDGGNPMLYVGIAAGAAALIGIIIFIIILVKRRKR